MRVSGRGLRWPALAGLILLASCTDFPPTETDNPATVPAEREDIVSVCYDAGDHSRRDIETVALQACGKGAVTVRPWRIDKFLNECPVLKRTRVSFLCVMADR